VIALSKIDWSTAKVETITEKIKELGIETNASSFEIRTFMNTMSGAF
jgi:hypothetical protein